MTTDMERLPALVAVTVPNMGRMALHRSEAQQIMGTSSAPSSSDRRSSISGASSMGNSSQTSGSTSLTQPSSMDEEDCDERRAAISPSFTIMSSFPASVHTTPARLGRGAAHKSSDGDDGISALLRASAAGLEGEERMRALRAALPLVKSRARCSVASTSYKPQLPGSDMPSLDWPDSVDGPWNASCDEVARRSDDRSRAIARWLAAESSDDEKAIASPASIGAIFPRNHAFEMSHGQHPMIAKAMRDRQRKEKLAAQRSAEIALQQQHYGIRLQQQTFSTPVSSERMNKRPKLGSRQSSSSRISSHKAMTAQNGAAMTASERRAALRQARRLQKAATKQMKRRNGLAKGAHPQQMAAIACHCGHGDNGSPMIQCDGCATWHHGACVGLHDVRAIGPEWLCLACCGSDGSFASPGSVADSTAASLMVTPNFPRSAAIEGHALRLSQGELPVFYHPNETPFRRPEGHAHNGLSSALALAPSPIMRSTEGAARSGQSAAISSAQAGRARAARVGWHMQEPGSPLDRKSSFSTHRRTASGAGQTLRMGHGHDGGDSASVSLYPDTHPDFLHMGLQTPKRQRMPSGLGFGRSQSGSNVASSDSRRRDSAVRDFDDIFSTPSRMLHGMASWDNATPAGMSRHSRLESNSSAVGTDSRYASTQRPGAGVHGTPWGLSTPTRGFVDSAGIFTSSDYSGAADGLPSLVHSSGGVDFGDVSSWQQLQGSPTSSTRAGARAAQSSNNAASRKVSSVRESTPEGLLYSTDPNSSPFPKTPTFVSDHYGGSLTNGGFSASRRMSMMSHAFPPSPMATPSRKGNGAMAAPRHRRNISTASNAGMLESLAGPLELASERRLPGLGSNKAANGTGLRSRKASTDVMAGLGIGLDLNDVLDWQ